MTATAHALMGGIIAASVPNPAIGLPLAAASHPLLDLIPHWDFGWGWRKKSKTRFLLQAIFDLLLGLVLVFLLFGDRVDPMYLLAAVFLSLVWDFLEAPYWFLGWKFPPFVTFYSVGHTLQGKTKSALGGILTQVAVITGLFFVFRLLGPYF